MPSPPPARTLAPFLETAHVLADAAGAAILPHFRKAIPVENKDAKGFDPVTKADKAAERVMRKLIKARHPDHGVIGEEYAATEGVGEGSGRYNWVLDPIDGTRAFIIGYPLWGVLIGLNDGTVPVVGMMDQPYTRERFWAVSGAKGAMMRSTDGRERKIKTRACQDIGLAILGCTSPDMFKTPRENAAFAAVSKRARMTRFGGDCYAYALLAAGGLDLVIEAGLKAVDIAPLIPIIEAAGGVVTTWDGGSAAGGGNVIAAGDARMHKAAMDLVAGGR